MKRHYLPAGAAAAIVFTALLAASCGFMPKKLPTRNYYIINYTPVVTTPLMSKRPYPYSLHVGDFEVQAIFNRLNILYRFSPHQIQYYEIEQWAVRPEEMVTNLVFKHFEASGLTNHVGTDFFDTRPDFRIEGMVEAIEKYDAGDMFFAHLAMSMKLLRVADGQQVWEYQFDQRRQVYNPQMVYTVQSLSGIFQSEMDIVVGQLDSLFLSMSAGQQAPARPSAVSPQPSKTIPDSTTTRIDESGFEIVPEKPRTNKP